MRLVVAADALERRAPEAAQVDGQRRPGLAAHVEGRAPDTEAGGHRASHGPLELVRALRGHDAADVVGAGLLEGRDAGAHVVGRDHGVPVDADDDIARAARDRRVQPGRRASRGVVDDMHVVVGRRQRPGHRHGAVPGGADGDDDVELAGIVLLQEPLHGVEEVPLLVHHRHDDGHVRPLRHDASSVPNARWRIRPGCVAVVLVRKCSSAHRCGVTGGVPDVHVADAVRAVHEAAVREDPVEQRAIDALGHRPPPADGRQVGTGDEHRPAGHEVGVLLRRVRRPEHRRVLGLEVDPVQGLADDLRTRVLARENEVPYVVGSVVVVVVHLRDERTLGAVAARLEGLPQRSRAVDRHHGHRVGHVLGQLPHPRRVDAVAMRPHHDLQARVAKCRHLPEGVLEVIGTMGDEHDAHRRPCVQRRGGPVLPQGMTSSLHRRDLPAEVIILFGQGMRVRGDDDAAGIELMGDGRRQRVGHDRAHAAEGRHLRRAEGPGDHDAGVGDLDDDGLVVDGRRAHGGGPDRSTSHRAVDGRIDVDVEGMAVPRPDVRGHVDRGSPLGPAVGVDVGNEEDVATTNVRIAGLVGQEDVVELTGERGGRPRQAGGEGQQRAQVANRDGAKAADGGGEHEGGVRGLGEDQPDPDARALRLHAELAHAGQPWTADPAGNGGATGRR